MWRADPIPVLVPEEIQIPERRRRKRMYTAVPLTIQIIGTPEPPPPVTVQTADISLQGVSIFIPIQTQFAHGRFSIPGGEDSIKMSRYLLLHNKQMDLGIGILPQGESIRAEGTVRWYARSFAKGLYSVRAGVLIEKMEAEHSDAWMEFINAVSQFLAILEPSRG